MDNQEKRSQPPLLFLVFNRPDTTQEVLKAIRVQRPERLYVACDGPRDGRPDEREAVHRVRQMIAEGVDWPCSLFTLYRDTNLGCKKAVSSALDWFLKTKKRGSFWRTIACPIPIFGGFVANYLTNTPTMTGFL